MLLQEAVDLATSRKNLFRVVLSPVLVVMILKTVCRVTKVFDVCVNLVL